MKKLIVLLVLSFWIVITYSQEDNRVINPHHQETNNKNNQLDNKSQEELSEFEKLAKMASSLPKEKRQMFYSQYHSLKAQIAKAENESFKWGAREDLAKEMNNDGDGAKYAGAIHGILAAVKKEDAEEKLKDAINKKALLEEALRIAYERTESVQNVQKDSFQNEPDDNKIAKNNHNNYNVINHKNVSIAQEQDQIKLSEGGHLLMGQTSICFLIDPSMQKDQCKLYSIGNVKYILINETEINRINEDLTNKVAELITGEYSFSNIIGNNDNTMSNHSREEAIPSENRTQRGL